jgi:hypothetical protein
MSYEIFFQRLAAAVTARDLDHVAEWFTEDFRLHEPGFNIPNGHAGAEAMLRTFLKLGPSMKVEVMDVIEAGDRAAVRWVFSGKEMEKASPFPALPCIGLLAAGSPKTGELHRQKGHGLRAASAISASARR